MLKKLSKKSVLLMTAALALCALAMPLAASAASWSPVGTSDGILESSNLRFSIAAPLTTGWLCRSTRLTTAADSAAALTITSAALSGCHSDLGFFSGCTFTSVGTGFPWRTTALSTTDIRIHGINIDIRFATTPPAGSVPCLWHNADMTLTGNLGLGTPGQTTWDAATRSVAFTNTTGLFAHIPGLASGLPMAVNGTLRATGLLNILD